MRIGIEAQRLYRADKHGMDVVALETIRRLVRLAPQHTFVVFVRPGPAPCLPDADNLEVRCVPGWSYPSWEQWALPRAVSEAGVDLLHATANTAPLRVDVPLLVTLHDVIFLEGAAPWRRGGTWYQRLGNTYRRWVVPPAIRQARAVATVSHHEKDRITDHFPEMSSRVFVAPNGVDPRFAPVDDRRERERIVLKKVGLPRSYFFFLGNTDPKKNLDGVLHAYARYADAHDRTLPLVIADFHPTRLRAALQTIGRPDLQQHIRLPGYIDHADLPAVYSAASGFLYPSRRESFGLPILEAMACGTPVITSDAAAMPETAGEAALLVDPDRPSDLAGAMRRVVADTRLRRRLRDRGLRRAGTFSWERTARRLLRAYEEMCATAGRSSPRPVHALAGCS